MSTFKTIPPKQKYMTIPEMYRNFESRGIIAYSCKIVNSVLEGGVVIAVQDEADADSGEIKKYQRQLRKQHPDKAPIYYLRLEPGEGNQRISLTYDNGSGEKKIMPKLEVVKSEAEQALSSVPTDLLAQALATIKEKSEL